MLIAAQLINIRLMQVLGVSLVAMAVISVAIFEFVIKDGVRTTMESGHVVTQKGEEHDTVLSIESRGAGWIGTSFKIETGQQMATEPISEGKVRIRFLGKYAGRMEGVKVEISLSDPLHLLKRTDTVVHREFVLDTLPQSLLASVMPVHRTIYGFGEAPTGFPGPGQELYGLDRYNPGMETKNIIWKRVAKSSDESLIASVRESSVRDVVRVGIVRFAERGDEREAWGDMLCEALGQIGKEAFEMGAGVQLVYFSPPKGEAPEERKKREDEVFSPEIVHAKSAEVMDLAEALMACSVALPSREVEAVVADSDIIVTGLKELEDDQLAKVLAERPLLLIHEAAAPSSAFTEKSVIWTGNQNLFSMVRKVVEA